MTTSRRSAMLVALLGAAACSTAEDQADRAGDASSGGGPSVQTYIAGH